MSDNIYERIHRTLTWRRVIAFNALLFLVTVVPISVRLAQQDTENRSSASTVAEAPVVTPPPSYPPNPPKIDRVSEFYGKKGDTVILIGNNFGNYKWGSKVYVGDVEATDESVVRWSNNILEVQIPEGARTGRVWISVNGKQSTWDGTLLLYDVVKSAQIAITKQNNNNAVVSLTNAVGVSRGIIEIGHVSEPLELGVISGQVVSQNTSIDSLGKKTIVEFRLDSPLGSSNSNILLLTYPGVGNLEILRAELYDTGNRLVTVYADPFSVKTD